MKGIGREYVRVHRSYSIRISFVRLIKCLEISMDRKILYNEKLSRGSPRVTENALTSDEVSSTLGQVGSSVSRLLPVHLVRMHW